MDRMIGRLTAHLDESNIPAGVGGGIAHDLQELLRSEMVRAGGGGDDRSGRSESKGAQIDLLVAADGRLRRLGALGERRRVENDEAETLLPAVELLEMIEGVSFDPLAALREPVQRGVAAGQLETVRRDLDRGAAFGPGLERVETERPGVTSQVDAPRHLYDNDSTELANTEASLLSRTSGVY